MAQVTEMYRVINFVLETKTLGLRVVPMFNDGIWKLEALSDYMNAKSKLVYTVHEMNKKKDIEDEETRRMLES